MKTPRFPEDFYSFGTSVISSHVDDVTINEWIGRVKNELNEQYERKPKRLCYFSIASGNALVHGTRYKDEVSIYVSKNYHVFDDIIDE